MTVEETRLAKTFTEDGRVIRGGRTHGRTEPAKSEFIEWLATPVGARDPRTKSELADKLGVDRSTLFRWEQQQDVILSVQKRTHQVFSVQKLSDLVENLATIAFDEANNASARVSATAKLLDWHQRAMPKDQASAPLAEMPLADLKALAANLYDEIDDRLTDEGSSGG